MTTPEAMKTPSLIFTEPLPSTEYLRLPDRSERVRQTPPGLVRTRRRSREVSVAPVGWSLQHRVALRLELGSRLPLRKLLGLRQPVADHPVVLEVLHGAAHLPLRLHLVGRLVIVVRRVGVRALLAPSRRLADEVDAATARTRGHALLCEREVVGSIEAASFRIGVGPNLTPLPS